MNKKYCGKTIHDDYKVFKCTQKLVGGKCPYCDQINVKKSTSASKAKRFSYGKKPRGDDNDNKQDG